MNIPKFIFIVPYRDREAQKNMFSRMMDYILEDVKSSDYEIYYSHQKDKRSFNRGAMKNLGFLHIKEKYPQHYKDITFVFNDVDTLPGIKNLWDYNTKHRQVKHFYGYKFALGGIVSITGSDFEKINGYPNFWGWGFEDNELNYRCLANNIIINRDIFYDYGHNDILQFNNTIERKIDNKGLHKYKKDNGMNGIRTITNIKKNELLISKNSFIIDFTNWEIPEKDTNINFRIKNSRANVYSNKKQINNIMGGIISMK